MAEWRFRPLMRIVIVNPRIWKVKVIGIGTPPLQRIPGKNRPSLCWRPWGSNEPRLFYQTSRKMSIHAPRFAPLDKSRVSGIIKITKAPSARTVWPRIKLVFQEISKPSLCRVAVSAIYADGDRKSKNMERDRNRHLITSFTG